MFNPYAQQQLNQLREAWLQAEQQSVMQQQMPQQSYPQPQQAQQQSYPQVNQQQQQPQRAPAKPIYSRGIGQKPFENQDRRFGGYAKLTRRTPYYNRNV